MGGGRGCVCVSGGGGGKHDFVRAGQGVPRTRWRVPLQRCACPPPRPPACGAPLGFRRLAVAEEPLTHPILAYVLPRCFCFCSLHVQALGVLVAEDVLDFYQAWKVVYRCGTRAGYVRHALYTAVYNTRRCRVRRDRA